MLSRLTGLCILLSVLFSPAFAYAQSDTIQVTVGDSFTVTRPVSSSFLTWELGNFDARKVSLDSSSAPDTVGSYRFHFSALESGEVNIPFSLFRRTQLFDQKIDNHVVHVDIQDVEQLREQMREQRSQEWEREEEEEEPRPAVQQQEQREQQQQVE
ncbi:MAG: hypothetical protein ABEJ65_10470, partial [bacterium]